ncbi:hypothetical protein WJ97_12260 [Burkholderia ubonensis]|nr:hypothetical protein [Burkholderia ubonensis]KVP96650.1 hypothetical protein WJ97_12260 [Burkholderia ubonensis]
MNKAYLTIVVDGTSVKDLENKLADCDIGKFRILARGDIAVADESKDETVLPNKVWLYEACVDDKRKLRLVEDSHATEGRVLTEEELAVLQQFGVCTDFKSKYPDAEQYGSPLYFLHEDAAAAEASSYGFKVLAEGFATSFENGDDGAEERWLRIIMPAWFNLSL